MSPTISFLAYLVSNSLAAQVPSASWSTASSSYQGYRNVSTQVSSISPAYTSSPFSGTPALSACPVLDGALPSDTPSNLNFSQNVRRYYVTTELVDWNYAPTRWDNWLGVPLPESPRVTGVSNSMIFSKAHYIGYTDATFSQRTKRLPSAGINGKAPILSKPKFHKC